MADESQFTLYTDDPRVGTLTKEGAVENRPQQFMSGDKFNRAVPHTIRRIDGKYCIAFTMGMKQEGEYRVLPAKTASVSRVAPSTSVPSSSDKSSKDAS